MELGFETTVPKTSKHRETPDTSRILISHSVQALQEFENGENIFPNLEGEWKLIFSKLTIIIIIMTQSIELRKRIIINNTFWRNCFTGPPKVRLEASEEMFPVSRRIGLVCECEECELTQCRL